MGDTQQVNVRINGDGSLSIPDTLPSGVFFSPNPLINGAAASGLLSVNATGSYDFVFTPADGVTITGNPALNPQSGAFTLPSPNPPTVSDVVGTGPAAQQTASLSGTLDTGASFVCWFANNPAVLEVPVGVASDGTITPGNLPLGVTFDASENNQFTVTGAGVYNFAFTVNGLTFENFDWQRRPPEVFSRSRQLGTSELDVNNENLTSFEDNKRATFTLTLSNGVKIDPTVVNTPINQGGTGGTNVYPAPKELNVAA